MAWYATQASSNGGTTVARRGAWECIKANLTSAAFAPGTSDHKSATAPVTKGAATLVPPSVSGFPSAPRLVMPSPGALSPRLPMELPKVD
jgi:hypothetical protein